MTEVYNKPIYKIQDILGRNIIEATISESITNIPINNLKAGLYIIHHFYSKGIDKLTEVKPEKIIVN